MAAKKPNPALIDDENPEWTDADFARARPASEVLPPELYDSLAKRKPGQRGAGKKPTKIALTIRIDPNVVARFKAQGPGWQTRMGEILTKAAPKQAAGKRR
jgi:uncharacterized protein (DUF4415 family)